jgi:F0F1-type ATP synthase membrane subunit b/b'
VKTKQDLQEIRLDTISNAEHFKAEAEKIIATQEKNIDEFKAKLATEKKEANADLNEKLEELEKKNNELKNKLADYQDDGQDKWTSFKNEFNHDMNELGKAFKGLTKDDKE